MLKIENQEDFDPRTCCKLLETELQTCDGTWGIQYNGRVHIKWLIAFNVAGPAALDDFWANKCFSNLLYHLSRTNFSTEDLVSELTNSAGDSESSSKLRIFVYCEATHLTKYFPTWPHKIHKILSSLME